MAAWTIRRELHNPPHPFEARLNTLEDLRGWLKQLCEEGDSNFHLENEATHDELTVLMDRPLAAISFMRSDTTAFSASTDPNFESNKDEDHHEFDLGGTPTPVSKDRCISFDAMVRIVEYTFLHATLPSWIGWRQP